MRTLPASGEPLLQQQAFLDLQLRRLALLPSPLEARLQASETPRRQAAGSAAQGDSGALAGASSQVAGSEVWELASEAHVAVSVRCVRSLSPIILLLRLQRGRQFHKLYALHSSRRALGRKWLVLFMYARAGNSLFPAFGASGSTAKVFGGASAAGAVKEGAGRILERRVPSSITETSVLHSLVTKF